MFIRDKEYVESEIEKMGLTSKIKQIEYMKENTQDKYEIGKFKAEKIKELGLDVYLDDDPKVVFFINECLKEYEYKCDIIYINRLHYVVFTFNFEGLSYATKLEQEGNDVVLGVLSLEDVGKKNDDPETEKKRVQNGDGLIKKFSSKEIIKMLKSIPDEEKKDYFIDFDFNWAPEVAQTIKDMGFDGLFPEEIDRQMEEERQLGQDMVKKKLYRPEIARRRRIQISTRRRESDPGNRQNMGYQAKPGQLPGKGTEVLRPGLRGYRYVQTRSPFFPRSRESRPGERGVHNAREDIPPG